MKILFSDEQDVQQVESCLRRIDQELDKHLAKVANPGLMNGLAGIGLYKALMWQHFRSENFLGQTEDILNQIFDLLEIAEVQDFSFCDGLPGIALFLDYLTANQVFSINIPTIFRTFLPSIRRGLDDYLLNKDYDFLYGAVGIGIFMLETNEGNMHDGDIEKIINGITAHSSLHFNGRKLERVEGFSQIPQCNLGLAHGLPAAIVFLSRCYQSKILPQTSITLASELVNFVLSCRNESVSDISLFPMVTPDEVSEHARYSRLGWCYGDLAIASALLQFGVATDNAQLIADCADLFTQASQRENKSEIIPIIDPFFCHGTSGIAFMFKLAYENTGVDRFQRSYFDWLDYTLSFLKDEDFWFKIGAESKNLTFLLGLSGTAAVLLSAISNEPDRWRKLLLL